MNATATKTTTAPTERKKSSMFSDPARLLDFSNYLYGIAAALTLIATFGVIYFGKVVASLKDSQVQEYIKNADAEIAHANERAAGATERAAQAHSAAEAAAAVAANARAVAASANAEAEKSKTERAKLELQLMQVTQQTAALTAAAAPRQISIAQQMKIVAGLRSVSGQKIDVNLLSATAESQSFASEVVAILERAGMVVTRNNFIGKFGTGWGIVLNGKEDKLTETTIVIIDAFRSAGLPIGPVVPNGPSGLAEQSIFIGDKPIAIK